MQMQRKVFREHPRAFVLEPKDMVRASDSASRYCADGSDHYIEAVQPSSSS
jgi:hypothetical protein